MSRKLTSVLRIIGVVIATYVVSWHAAFILVYVIGLELQKPTVSIREIAVLYINSLVYLWRPGLELASATQMLAVASTIVVGVIVIWKHLRRPPSGT